MFVPLNVHSHFSAMRGTMSQTQILHQAKAMGMSSIALTEVNGLWGFIRFVQHARNAGVKPIAGVNLITEKEDVVLLAENLSGYQNLSRIISFVHDDPSQSVVPLLSSRSAGLFVLAHQRDTLNDLSSIIPDTHLFVELRPGVSENQAAKLSREYGLEIVATGNVYFHQQDDHRSHRVLRAIEGNTTLSDIPENKIADHRCWFRSEKEMIDLFPNSLEAINNSQYLADRCKTDWSFVNTVFPGLSLKETHRANEMLKKFVREGAEARYQCSYNKLSTEVKERIRYELELILQKGFAPYFLIVRDIVQQTKSTIGRGSAAASIVSYCLFITQVDPIRYYLRFERFIHAEREDMPDIDVDFPWDERDDILEYVFEKYGEERTAMVSNQVFLRPRSAVREVAKVFGFSEDEIKHITKRMGYYASRRDLETWIRTDSRFAAAKLDDALWDVIRESEKIIGVFRNSSVHPGGVVIVPDEIRKYVPVLKAPKGVFITEWEKDQVEDSGLLKIDLLGNRSLSVVRDTLKQINLNRGIKTSSSRYMNYHEIQPVGDPKTEALMKAGKTMGVFYIESPATRQLLAKAGKVDFEHVVIYSSIIRPAANRFINIMLERIHGKPWELLHPDLAFLEESYGIMVYEEQVSLAARVMAGMSYAQSDVLRKTMSRTSLQHLISSWKKKFTHGAQNRGYPEEIIEKVWDMIASFHGYSFCKPHSASYAMLSFTCAYLKTHYPAEFLASVLTNRGGYYSAYAYLGEARRWGIRILPPDIHHSNREYLGDSDQIRMGFMSIKGLKDKVTREILAERKTGAFESLEDFLTRVEPDLSDAILLTNAGCFRGLELEKTHRDIAYRVAAFCLRDSSRSPVSDSPNTDPLTRDERHQMEINTFGFPITYHPLMPYRSKLDGKVLPAKEIPNHVGKTIRLAGVYITRKDARTRHREAMEFLTLEDETDIFECVLFPDVFREYGDLIHWEKLFLIRGKVEEAYGVCTVTIEKMASLSRLFKTE